MKANETVFRLISTDPNEISFPFNMTEGNHYIIIILIIPYNIKEDVQMDVRMFLLSHVVLQCVYV